VRQFLSIIRRPAALASALRGRGTRGWTPDACGPKISGRTGVISPPRMWAFTIQKQF